jgi:hypothetical protein
MKKMSKRRIIFSGDSFIRQVVIAFACLFEQHMMVEKSHMGWASCLKKWPCHGAKNCVQCGPHSGSNSLEFSLKGASRHPQFLFVNENTHDGTSIGKLGSEDVVFLEPGIFSSAMGATEKAWGHVASHVRSKTKVVWVHTWPAHFSATNGEYNVTELEHQQQKYKHKQLVAGGSNSSWSSASIAVAGKLVGDVSSRCVEQSNFDRKIVEAGSMNFNKKGGRGHLLDGVIWLNGIEKLGSAKVSEERYY